MAVRGFGVTFLPGGQRKSTMRSRGEAAPAKAAGQPGARKPQIRHEMTRKQFIAMRAIGGGGKVKHKSFAYKRTGKLEEARTQAISWSLGD